MDINGKSIEILLKVYNDGFVMGELGKGLTDQESTDEALSEWLNLPVSEGDCDNCDGIGSLLDCTYADSNTSPPCPKCNGTGKLSKPLKPLIEETQNE